MVVCSIFDCKTQCNCDILSCDSSHTPEIHVPIYVNELTMPPTKIVVDLDWGEIIGLTTNELKGVTTLDWEVIGYSSTIINDIIYERFYAMLSWIFVVVQAIVYKLKIVSGSILTDLH